MKSLVTVSDTQRGSQSYVEKIKERREIEVTRRRRGGIKKGERNFSSIQFSSVTQSCPTLCDPMNCSTPDLPVHHHLPEFTQNYVHRVRDAIKPSHPLSSPSPPCPQSLPASGSFPMSQLFVSGSQSTGVSALASFLPKNTHG